MKVKKNKSAIVAVSILCILALSAAINFFMSEINAVSVYGTASQEAIEVSLVTLIATPEQYDGKTVRVVGVGKIGFESNGLYLSKEDYQKAVTKNAVWLSIDEEKLSATYEGFKKTSGKYVLVEGVFNSKNQGHFDGYSGTIENITRYESWK